MLHIGTSETKILCIGWETNQKAKFGRESQVVDVVLDDDIVKVMCNLKTLNIVRGEKYKHVIQYSSTSIPILPKIKSLYLIKVENIDNMFASCTVIPNGSFERLKKIKIQESH